MPYSCIIRKFPGYKDFFGIFDIPGFGMLPAISGDNKYEHRTKKMA
jgi:hypothetical protein